MKRNLTVARKLREAVVIEINGQTVEVEVKKTGDNKIKLNFYADEEIHILRRELIRRSIITR